MPRLRNSNNRSIGKAMESLQGFASIDMSGAIDTRDRIAVITKMIEDKSVRLQEGVLPSMASVRKYANEVTDIVMSMQFQDISRQRLEKVVQALGTLREQLVPSMPIEQEKGQSDA